MRLIDADALKAEWYRLNDINEENCGARFVGYQEIARLINNAPTVQPTGDLISRADAMGAVQDHFNANGFKGYDDGQKMLDRIKALPSADAVTIHEDGTLEVKVSNAHKVGRVLVMDTDSHIGGGLFYPDDSDAEWIPCSERLPIPPMFCLVTTDGSHGDVIDIALYMSDGWHKASEVIAWIPLPTPYKGGDDK